MADERGSGLLGTLLGVGVFLLLVLLAAQVLVHLYATSVVEAVAYDAAGAVSAEGGADTAAAEAHARALLGRMGDDAEFDWTVDADEVAVHVAAPLRPVLPQRVAEPLGLDRVERGFRMRVERFR